LKSFRVAPRGAYSESLKGAYLGSVEKFHSDFGYLVTPDVAELINRGAADYDNLIAVSGGRPPSRSSMEVSVSTT
jgi:hypothetical protein